MAPSAMKRPKILPARTVVRSSACGLNEEAREPRGKHRAHQFTIGVGLAQQPGSGIDHGGGGWLDGAVLEQEESHDAGEDEVERTDQLEESAEQDPLLPLLERRRGKRALDDLLIGAPVEDVDEDDAGEDFEEWCLSAFAADGVDVLRNVGREVAEPLGDRAALGGGRAGEVDGAAGPEAEERDHETADEEADAIEEVRNHDGAEASEDGVDGADDADEPDHAPEESGIVLDAGDGVEVEDAHHALRAGEEDHRQQDEHVGKHEDDVAGELGARSEAHVEKLGDGRDAALEELRQEEERHEDDGEDADHLPHHDGEARGVALPVETHELLGGEVGEQQGSRDEGEGEGTPGEEEAAVRGDILAPALPPGDEGDERREEYERQEGCDHGWMLLVGRRLGAAIARRLPDAEVRLGHTPPR